MNILKEIAAYRESHGTAYTIRRAADKAVQRVFGTYHRKWKKLQPDEATLQQQREHQPEAGLISVVIPVYNTPAALLNALLESLKAQTYTDFEAVLYDGGSDKEETLRRLDAAAEEEPRFRVIHGEENRGISGNTNEAIRLAKGDYIALCDHDDLLSPEALWRAAERIAQDQPDFLYSDEDRLADQSQRHIDPHYKPEYCPDNLVSDNYICHMSVIRKDLLEAVGGLRSGFDGSQDHDLFLRCAERTDRIAHLPYTLYSWRELRSSMSHQNLQKCLDNGCRAAVEHEARMGRTCDAAAVNKEIRLWYEIPKGATIEALIHGESEAACRACLGEMEFLSPWPGMSAALITGDGAKRLRLINEAAASSQADYLLIIEAGVGGMNRHFLREMMMYAQRDDVAGVTPVITDEKKRILHGGFALGTEIAARCINEGMYATAGGWHDMMNKVHNVGAVSCACMLVKRSNWIPFDEGFRGGLAAADLAMRQREAGRRYVFTPHAQALAEKSEWLLNGRQRDAGDLARLQQKWGELTDPCYSTRFIGKKANYRTF